MNKLIALMVFSAAAAAALGRPFEPAALLLTWQQDPTTTMTIDWHSIDGEAGPIRIISSPGHQDNIVTHPVVEQRRPTQLEYRRTGDNAWRQAGGSSHPFPFVEERIGGMHRDGNSHPFAPQGRTVHRVELSGLAPDSLYEFRFDSAGPVHTFRTMPARLTREVRIAMGGDVGYGVWAERMHRLAASYDPDFVVWGGDLAYADGEQGRLGRWYDFFDGLTRSLVTEDNRRIPVVTGLGNHETFGGYYNSSKGEQRAGGPYQATDGVRASLSPYFYSFFSFPGQPGYGVLDFGDYLSVLLLDSGHNNPIEGAQTEWLEGVLSARSRVPHVFPTYHVPAFPSYRSLSDARVVAMREHWVPLFEKHRLPVVFENHDHNYKRTFPIRQERKAEGGVVYLGDGAWGTVVTGFAKDHSERWYLDRAEPLNHFILARLKGPVAEFEAIGLTGQPIDRYSARRR